jgi:hypothetical protein
VKKATRPYRFTETHDSKGKIELVVTEFACYTLNEEKTDKSIQLAIRLSDVVIRDIDRGLVHCGKRFK